jgi:tetratricopeptide (TPR) repeat protein
MRYADDKIESRAISEGKDTTSHQTSLQPGLYPFNYTSGYRRGVSDFGTEYGIHIELLSFQVSAALRQALRTPLHLEEWAIALQVEALAAPGPYSLSAALAATRDFGSVEATLAVRSGWVQSMMWTRGTWGPGLEVMPVYPFLDLVAVLGQSRAGSWRSMGVDRSLAKLEFLARIPLVENVAIQDSTYSYSHPPYLLRYIETYKPGTWVGLRLSVDTLSFTSYAARHFTTPKKWMPRLPPDLGDEALHLGRANELDQAGMPVDAADEYQAVLRINPRSVTAHIALARIYLQLDEAKMAYFHAGRAVYFAPDAIGVKELWEKAQAAMGPRL